MKDGIVKRLLLKLYYRYHSIRYCIHAKFSLIAYRLSPHYICDKKILDELRNFHQDKRGFIICNGPSLNPQDLDVINENNEISFACNKIAAIYTKTKWRPTYYVQVNESVASKFLLKSMQDAEPKKWKFFRKDTYWQTRKIRGGKIYLNIDGNSKYLDNPQFSTDATKVIYAIGTTTYILLELAIFMGIREIYIIGCDNQYAKTRTRDGKIIENNTPNHFSDEYEETKMVMAESTWQMNVAYDFARKYADEHGIKIYNATRGGKLEAFERIKFETLF